MEARTGPEGSWESLGRHVGSQGPPKSIRRGLLSKIVPLLGPHLGVHFQAFARFLDTFLRSVFETAFRKLEVPILEGFWKVFGLSFGRFSV